MHTHACPDTLIERSRFPCVHTYTSKRRQKRDCTRPKRKGKARRRRLVVVRVSSRSSRSLSHPRFFGLATHERERERKTTTCVFPLFLHRASSCAKVVLLSAFDRTTRVVEVISTDVFFFSREKRQKNNPARDLPSTRVLPRARRHRTTVVETFETRFKRDALSGHRSL